MKRICQLVCLLSVCAPNGEAHAFSEPLLYSDDAINGGAGGRFFTGAPLDGFSCAVCHRGGTPPQVEVSGFPARFEPGERYEVTVSWLRPEFPHGLNLEVVDTEGRAAGELALAADDQLPESDRCVLSDDEATRPLQASYLVQSGARSIAGVRPCGARSFHFSFTAPERDEIALTGSVVRSNKSEDPEGDGVQELRLVSARVGVASKSVVGSGCSIGKPSSTAGVQAALLALLGWLWRRKRAG